MFGNLFNLLRVGSELRAAVLAKNLQNITNALGALILIAVQVAKGFGYPLPIDEGMALSIAGGFVAVVNVILTTISSKKVGVLPEK